MYLIQKPICEKTSSFFMCHEQLVGQNLDSVSGLYYKDFDFRTIQEPTLKFLLFELIVLYVVFFFNFLGEKKDMQGDFFLFIMLKRKLKKSGDKITAQSCSILNNIPYARHYNLRFVFFYPIFYCGLYCREVTVTDSLLTKHW